LLLFINVRRLLLFVRSSSMLDRYEYCFFVLRNGVVDVRICAVLHRTSILLVTTARRLVRIFFAETRQLHLLVIE
jgi:hypothetical protein